LNSTLVVLREIINL